MISEERREERKISTLLSLSVKNTKKMVGNVHKFIYDVQ